MATYIHKLIKYKDQYSITIPKALIKSTGLDKAKLVEIWSTEESIIHIRGFDGKNIRKNRVSGRSVKTD